MPGTGVGHRSQYRRSHRRSSVLVSVGLLAMLAFAATQAPAQTVLSVSEWTVYSGVWDFEKVGETSELGAELQRPLGPKGLSFVAGAAGTSQEAVWAYAGASWSWQPAEAWRLRPGFAVSVFDEGDGKDLGGPIEFRSSLEVSYRVRPRLRVGLIVYHLSNAGIYDLNPGSNSVVLALGFPTRSSC